MQVKYFPHIFPVSITFLRKMRNDNCMKTEEKFAHLFDRVICENYDARNIRDEILRETDKYLLSDYPVTAEHKQKIIEYRQFLRDVPKQQGFPRGVDWGEFPNEAESAPEVEA